MSTRTFTFPVQATSVGLPVWAQSVTVGSWYEIPNTNRAVTWPDPENVGPPSSQTNSWSGAAVRTDGSWMYFAAMGGHSDYGGNGVYAIQLGVDTTPTWQRLKSNGPISKMPNYSVVLDSNPLAWYFDDGTPSSRHTYGGIHYVPQWNKVVIFGAGTFNGAASYSGGGVGTYPAPNLQLTVNAFNLATNEWDAPNSRTPIPSGYGIVAPQYAALDPATGDVYLNNSQTGTMLKWTRATETFTPFGGVFDTEGRMAMCFDAKRNRIWSVGTYSPSTGLKYKTTTDSTVRTVTVNGPAAAQTFGSHGGLTYDSDADVLYIAQGYQGTPLRVWRFDPNTNYIEEVSVPATFTSSVIGTTGIYQRFYYYPQLKGIIFAPSSAQNIWYWRLH